jgi:hypothetical protein
MPTTEVVGVPRPRQRATHCEEPNLEKFVAAVLF